MTRCMMNTGVSTRDQAFGGGVVVACCLLAGALLVTSPGLAQSGPQDSAAKRERTSDFGLEIGLHGFKTSASKPNELETNAVFGRWEAINASPEYDVHDYVALKPLYFNIAFGVDALIRYRRFLMVKVGYDVTHPFGIGGWGHIAYSDTGSGAEISEKKEFSYTTHQISTFIGPIVDLADRRADVYLGFSPMAPTWVIYREHYERTENGRVVEDSNRKLHGFFGSCRALVGLQVRVAEGLKLGSEAVFAFLNYVPLESGGHTESTFRFPEMQWNITARYELF